MATHSTTKEHCPIPSLWDTLQHRRECMQKKKAGTTIREAQLFPPYNKYNT
jgi:hypothetical protein